MTVLRATCECDPMGEGIREHNAWCPLPELRSRPVLLLDVDGVVSVWGNGSLERPLSDWEFHHRTVGGVGLRVPHGIKRRLDRLHQAFDVWWCTGWEEHAAEALAPFLGSHVLHWPYFKWPNKLDASLTNCNWKIATIDRELTNRPAAWVDDNIGPQALDWATDRSNEREIPTTVVKTEAHVGLQDEHTERLLDWAAALTTSTV